MADDVVSLLKKLYTNDQNEMMQAQLALNERGTEAIEALIEVLRKEEHRRLWWHAILTLEHIGDARAVEPIIEFLKRPNTPDVVLARKYAAYALATFKDARAIDTLIDLLEEKEWAEDENDDETLYLSDTPAHETIEAAIGALASIGEWRGIHAAIERLLVGDTWCDCRMGEWGGERAYQYLVNVVACDDVERQGNAISLLGDFGDVRAVDVLIPFLDVKHPDNIRASAAYALKELRSINVLPVLFLSLADPHEQVQQHAVFGILGLVGPHRWQISDQTDSGLHLQHAIKQVGEESLTNLVLQLTLHAHFAMYGILLLEVVAPYIHDFALKSRIHSTLDNQSDELKSKVQNIRG